MSDAAHASEHPTPRKYFSIMIWLTVLTGIELLIVQPQVGLSKGALVIGLIVLALVKATLVAAYFMHLKMDPRRLSITLYAPVAALLVLLTILTFENINDHHIKFVDGKELKIEQPHEGEAHEAAHESAPAAEHK